MKILVWSAVAVLMGCASPTYVTANRDQFLRDSYECSRDSKTFGGGGGIVGALMIIHAQNQAQALYNQCMEAKGYQRAD